MTKRMLIDATHAEETRVVVLDGNRLEDFDVETSTKRQLKGNIYLAKVVRVEPSLQAAFVEYGGGRHGFLAFGEIHPDYYQIPVADRQRLLEMQAEDARREEEEEDRAAAAEEAGETVSANVREIEISQAEPETIEHGGIGPGAAADEPGGEARVGEYEFPPVEAPVPEHAEPADTSEDASATPRHEPRAQAVSIERETVSDTVEALTSTLDEAPRDEPTRDEPTRDEPTSAEPQNDEPQDDKLQPEFAFTAPAGAYADRTGSGEVILGDAAVSHPASSADLPAEDFDRSETADVETYRGQQDPPAESAEDPREPRIPPRFLRNYKIQEVIKRRQILLIQVVKEERGSKGAALTTYISLAGRFCVLMPNSPRGGGISRKITSAADRRRLKEITAELAIPKGMGLIVRTAGAQRPKPEIKRDCEYLMRLWDDIREHTMRSVAPALIYEEASLIKRAIRDVYSRDVEDILVDGEDGWRAAHDFMRMLMPTHAKKVQLWRDPNGQPLFARHQVDAQLDAMMSPTVQLKSGGYLVINQAEALVAVDVNSGRSTRERGIEETALRTNLEAADEVARQLRLRDLAGLIVIDFIDMEAKKHNAMVERRLKEALKNDRARIQVGQISHFGLLEMSRQRLRPSLAETSFVACPHCGGLGHVRSTESAAIQVLRAIEEEGAQRRSAAIVVHAATSIALYVLNHKRERLIGIEARYGMQVTFASDESLNPPNIRIERVRAQLPGEGPAILPPEAWPSLPPPASVEAEIEDEDVPDTADDAGEDGSEEAGEAAEVRTGATEMGATEMGATEMGATETPEEAERNQRKRRRRRRGGRREDGTPDTAAAQNGADGEVADAQADSIEPGMEDEAASKPAASEGAAEAETAPGTEDEEAQRRRRGRRGGRRRRRDDDTLTAVAVPGAEQPDLPPAYDGPTPANPFGGRGYDIFEALERASEQAALTAPTPIPVQQAAPGISAEPAQPEPVAASVVVVPIRPAPPPEPEPVAEPVHAAPAMAEAPPAPEAEPVAGPVIQPINIDATAEPPAEKKRGWWRR